MRLVSLDNLRISSAALSGEWRAAAPYPAIVIDDFLDGAALQLLSQAFPPPSWSGWVDIGDRLQPRKRSSDRLETFDETIACLIHELYAGPFLSWLEDVTQFQSLQPDPHLWGGGLHCLLPGGSLCPHTDFLLSKAGDAKRVLNLILFLHPHWTQEMGGEFEIWSEGRLMRRVQPLPGRCVVFATDDHSVHGVSDVRGALPRQSVALFYYTALRSLRDFNIDHTTGWRLGLMRNGLAAYRLRQLVARPTMKLSLAFKYLADVLNAVAERIVTGPNGEA